MHEFITYSDEVKAAKRDNRPIVALESTIITHGMPWPDNHQTAVEVENVVREEGAIPATIAVIGGKIHVGLEPHILEQLAQSQDVMKLSRADFAACLAMKKTGATTVAATMIAAQLADIKLFATGGIGGVHRGAESSFDISADLEELSQTSVTVVAAGAKAILDLPKTLEVLETKGVPVITFGQSEFPAFWSRNSGFASPLRMDTPSEIANSVILREKLAIKGGQLVANPVPEGEEIPQEEISPIIEAALREADEQGIAAKKVTPFLLDFIFHATAGKSLKTNIALVKNNARLAARVACVLTVSNGN